MIDLDFLEIGTSDYSVYASECKSSEIGYIIEPIKFYLDNIPNKNNIKKFNLAIGLTNSTSYVYYVEPKEILAKNLPFWLRGCNSLGKPHDMHVAYNLLGSIKKQSVNTVTIEYFLTVEKIRQIKFLKIDTEGYDLFILKDLLKYLENKTLEFYPCKIEFETNLMYSHKEVSEIYQLYSQKGYRLIFKDSENSILKLYQSVNS